MQRLLSDEQDEVDFKGISTRPSLKSIVCGGRHNLVLTKDGKLFTFGFGQQG